MKVSEKSLELNVGAELLNLLRGPLGMPKAYLRGLTQREESQQGVDFFAQLNPEARVFAFQFKAPRGQCEKVPYRYTLRAEQHDLLHALAQTAPNGVFYVLPFYAAHQKLQQHVPDLLQDTWFLPVSPMATQQIFGGRRTRTVRCSPGSAVVNPEYRLQQPAELKVESSEGISAGDFASWYVRVRGHERRGVEREKRMSPWLVRGMRVAIVDPGA